jgi:hypothetical protein
LKSIAYYTILVNKIKKDKENYFRFLDPEREAIARKLIIIAELNKGFIADKRL